MITPTDPNLETIYWNLVTPILNPSGYWGDFNDVYQRYLTLVDFEFYGLMRGCTIPDPPNCSDYPNFT
jgi:hypothetical protein